MHDPMAANTLAEAAQWLTEATGRTWHERQVLDAVIRTSETSAEAGTERHMTAAHVLPPRSTPFSVYEASSDGEKSKFRLLQLNYKFPLSFDSAQDLFDYGDSDVMVASFPSISDNRLVLIEPQEKGLRITSEMVRLDRNALLDLSNSAPKQKVPYRLPAYSTLGIRSDEGNRSETWWSLRRLADHYGWDQKESRQIIERCVRQLPHWDGSVVRALMAGPTNVSQFAMNTHPPANVKHVSAKREHILNAEIAEAQKMAIDPTNSHSVFAALRTMAEQKYGVLLGIDGKEVKYDAGDEVKFFSQKMLAGRMERAAKRLAKAR